MMILKKLCGCCRLPRDQDEFGLYDGFSGKRNRLCRVCVRAGCHHVFRCLVNPSESEKAKGES